MSSPLSQALDTVLSTTIIPAAEAEILANKAAIIAALKSAGVNVIDEITTIILSNLKTDVHGILSVLVTPISAAISSAGPQLINALGGEEEGLFALVLHELDVLKTEQIF
jgi:hypothetical protein